MGKELLCVGFAVGERQRMKVDKRRLTSLFDLCLCECACALIRSFLFYNWPMYNDSILVKTTIFHWTGEFPGGLWLLVSGKSQ